MIRCLAIDDETLALDLLEDNISKVPFLHLVKRCKNAYEAIEILQTEKIDLLFLDIEMPGITGLQFLNSLQTKPMVIFITAYKQYALEGYTLDVLDYLVKPVPFERFLKAANKALEYYNFKNNETKPQVQNDYFFVNSEYQLVKIMSSEIAYIEGQKDYVQIHFINNSKPSVLTRMNFKEIEEKLNSPNFIRIHKSYIVAIDKITSVRASIIYIGEQRIPLGDNYRDEFFNTINPDTHK